jgi:CPA2 family monovalent cation:H+ antiporter-2
MFEEYWVKDLLLLLAVAGIVVPLFGWFRVGVVPGFLIAGVLLGPAGLGRVAADYSWLEPFVFLTPERVEPFADLGVLFLLFLIGLEFSLKRLWSMRTLVLGFGSLQFFVVALLILAGLLIVGAGFDDALVVGLALALSSTAIVTQVLIEAKRFGGPVGRVSLGILLFQDLMVVPIVIVIGVLARENVAVHGAILEAALVAVAALTVILIAGRYLVGPLLRLAAMTGSRELIVATALFLAIGTAFLTAEVGLSPALGAFLAGILLTESEYRHQLGVDIEPFKGLLLGLFFVTVGMSLEVALFVEMPVTFLGAVVALLVVNILVIYFGARFFGFPVPVAIEVAFVLAGAGEFAFVAFQLAENDNLFEPSFHEFVVSVAALSMIAIPILAFLGRWLGSRVERRDAEAQKSVDGVDGDALADHAIIAGFGRVGRTIARVLEAEKIPYVALDTDAKLVAARRDEGFPVYFGDASRREILESVGGATARWFVLTVEKPEITERTAKAILAAWPRAIIHARALDIDHARQLRELGVTDAVPEALEGSLQLAGLILAKIGLPDDAINDRLGATREVEIRQIHAEAGGRGAGEARLPAGQ